MALKLNSVLQYKQVQRSQVDLLPTYIADGHAIHCVGEGVTLLGGSGGMLPQKNLKN